MIVMVTALGHELHTHVIFPWPFQYSQLKCSCLIEKKIWRGVWLFLHTWAIFEIRKLGTKYWNKVVHHMPLFKVICNCHIQSFTKPWFISQNFVCVKYIWFQLTEKGFFMHFCHLDTKTQNIIGNTVVCIIEWCRTVVQTELSKVQYILCELC